MSAAAPDSPSTSHPNRCRGQQPLAGKARQGRHPISPREAAAKAEHHRHQHAAALHVGHKVPVELVVDRAHPRRNRVIFSTAWNTIWTIPPP